MLMHTNNRKSIVFVNHKSIVGSLIRADMQDQEPKDRLKTARIAAGYAKASDAARAIGVSPERYQSHENGWSGLSRAAPRYARFFRVSLDWLLTGRGDMKSASDSSIPIMGVVTAGQTVIPADGEASVLGEMSWPGGDEVHGFRVQGESMYPRFLDGELLLVEAQPKDPRQLLNGYALVQLTDGRRMVKMLRAGSRPGLYTLESHNAPPEHDVDLLAAWRWRGTLPK
jgi:phage repressor protein C with HTH and peptisase S24 domain